MSVADLLVPNPYPLVISAIAPTSVTTGHLTVTNTLGDGLVRIQTNNADPIVVNVLSSVSGNDVVFQNNGVRIASFGIDNTNNDVYVASQAASADVKILTNSIERLRIPAAGFATNEAATHALVQATGSTVVSQRTLDGGNYSPSFFPIAQFPAVVNLYGIWNRTGNSVSVSVKITGLQAAMGANSATVSLPIPPAANFTTAQQLIGPASYQSQTVTNTATITAQAGTTTAILSVMATAAMTSDLTTSFMYQIQ